MTRTTTTSKIRQAAKAAFSVRRGGTAEQIGHDEANEAATANKRWALVAETASWAMLCDEQTGAIQLVVWADTKDEAEDIAQSLWSVFSLLDSEYATE